MELDLGNPLDFTHNAETYSVAIAAVKLCDDTQQLRFLPFSFSHTSKNCLLTLKMPFFLPGIICK